MIFFNVIEDPNTGLAVVVVPPSWVPLVGLVVAVGAFGGASGGGGSVTLLGALGGIGGGGRRVPLVGLAVVVDWRWR